MPTYQLFRKKFLYLDSEGFEYLSTSLSYPTHVSEAPIYC